MSDTKVVCVKVAFIRPKYKNLKEWCKDNSNVYIGRKGVVFVDGSRYPKKDSIWANPFKISDKHDRDSVIEMYRKYIMKRIRTGEISKEEIEKLRGKNLGCWCKNPGDNSVKCHGDVLVEILNSDE